MQKTINLTDIYVSPEDIKYNSFCFAMVFAGADTYGA